MVVLKKKGGRRKKKETKQREKGANVFCIVWAVKKKTGIKTKTSKAFVLKMRRTTSKLQERRKKEEETEE